MSHTEKSEIFSLQYRLGRGERVTPPRILVSNGTSPFCVKLNFPAIGHLTGTGFLAEKNGKIGSYLKSKVIRK